MTLASSREIFGPLGAAKLVSWSLLCPLVAVTSEIVAPRQGKVTVDMGLRRLEFDMDRTAGAGVGPDASVERFDDAF